MVKSPSNHHLGIQVMMIRTIQEKHSLRAKKNKSEPAILLMAEPACLKDGESAGG